MRTNKVLYYTGITMSMLMGVWHFFVPWMFQWYSYIPSEYEVLKVSINWVNLCFSLFLFGISLIMLLWGKKVLAYNKEAITIYGFLVTVWIFRVIIAVVNPCPPEANVWLSYGQFVGSILIMIMMLIPFIRIMKECMKNISSRFIDMHFHCQEINISLKK